MKKFLLSAMLLVSTCSAAPISAQETNTNLAPIFCDKTELVREMLTVKYQEKLLFAAPEDSGVVVQIWTKQPDRSLGKTWTLLISYQSGMSCAYAAGREWFLLLPPNV